MKKDVKSLEVRLRELDKQIEEVKMRLPAHSVKPPIMMDLFELEDERDLVIKELMELMQKRVYA